MLVDGGQVLAWARANGGAAGSFNTYNLETTRAIITAAEAENAPIFLAVGRGALDYGGFELLARMCVTAATGASVPVALHLDHALELDLVERAVGAGFTSFMVDGSALPLADNISLLSRARALVADLSLEGELGGVTGDEDRAENPGTVGERNPVSDALTDPNEAARLVAATGVNSLAVAIGNAHGVYRGEPRLDLARLAAIHRVVPVPLVLHGASGLAPELIRACIGNGVVKINVNTEIRRAFYASLGSGVARPDHGFDLVGLFTPAMAAMTGVVRSMIQLFRSPEPIRA